MPRRPWFLRINLFATLERLRSILWGNRLKTFFKSRRAKSSHEDDAKARQAKPEVVPLGWRNPPSESIGNVALPLAATAAAVAAVMYFSDAEAGASEARLSAVSADLSRDLSLSPSAALDAGGGGGGGGRWGK